MKKIDASILPVSCGNIKGEVYIITGEELEELKNVSPLTGLPGNARINQIILEKFIKGPENAMIVYMDINGFKANY